MQLDSLADLVVFGVVPPVVFYAFFAARPQLGWSTPLLRAALVACARRATSWSTAIRLARFNVASAHGPVAHYTGTPSTMTAGIVGVAFLTALKYSDPSCDRARARSIPGACSAARLDAVVPYLPLLLLLGAVGMLSPLRVPKLGRTRSRALTVVLAVTVAFGYGAGLFHRLPEYMLAGGLFYLGVCVLFHLSTR